MILAVIKMMLLFVVMYYGTGIVYQTVNKYEVDHLHLVFFCTAMSLLVGLQFFI